MSSDSDSERQEAKIKTVDEDTWKICCSRSSATCVRFSVQVALSFIVIIFCFYQIATTPGQSHEIHYSILSSILSIYMPSPLPHGDKN